MFEMMENTREKSVAKIASKSIHTYFKRIIHCMLVITILERKAAIKINRQNDDNV